MQVAQISNKIDDNIQKPIDPNITSKTLQKQRHNPKIKKLNPSNIPNEPKPIPIPDIKITNLNLHNIAKKTVKVPITKLQAQHRKKQITSIFPVCGEQPLWGAGGRALYCFCEK